LRNKKSEGQKKTSNHRFTIKTELLDAGSQYKSGMLALKEKKFGKAVEFFEFAYDVDPKPRYLAYLGWSRFLHNPDTGLDDLSHAAELDPQDLEIKRLVKKSQGEVNDKRR
jgi:tetratricopeptide (TPR) repeat protein